MRPFQQSRDLLSIPLEWTHEPCVPTFQSHPFHRVIPLILRANMTDMTYIAHQINFFMWPYSPSVAVFNNMNGYKILGNRMGTVTPTPLKRTANKIFRHLLLPFRIRRNETSMFKTSNFRLQSKRGRVVG